MSLRVTPVDVYCEPDVPTRQMVEEHPELLMLVPKRWRTSPVVLSAVGAACMFLSGCRGSGSPPTPSSIAPIFVHGDGRGSFGCVAVNPPVFLSEDEARQVVNDEAKHAGIVFARRPAKTVTARGPVTDKYSHSDTRKSRMRTIEMDGYDSRRAISYEFVSERDFNNWHVSWLRAFLGGVSTVSRYDLRGAAETLRNGMAACKPRGVYAVFYDPCVGRMDVAAREHRGAPEQDLWKFKVSEAQKKDLAREELREQVRDFIKWLKAEGVI